MLNADQLSVPIYLRKLSNNFLKCLKRCAPKMIPRDL